VAIAPAATMVLRPPWGGRPSKVLLTLGLTLGSIAPASVVLVVVAALVHPPIVPPAGFLMHLALALALVIRVGVVTSDLGGHGGSSFACLDLFNLQLQLFCEESDCVK
jgi:hypothetical protein